MRLAIAAAIVLAAAATPAWAGPECTTADKSQWQDAANCYEIYGWNKAKQKVEIYFDPVTGKAIKTEIN